MKNTSNSWLLFIIAILVLISVAAGVLATKYYGGRHFIALAVVATAIVTFFGFLRLGLDKEVNKTVCVLQ